MKRLITALFVLFFAGSLSAECFLRIEKAGSYDPVLVNENAIAHISNFIEKVNSIPSAGIREGEGCVYNVNIIEDDRGIIVTVSGDQMNSSGDSRLRGFDGFQQALLRAINKSKPEQLGRICNAYSALMKDECQRQTGADYSIASKRLPSNPVAAKKYKMALIFKKRGKPEKTALFFNEILKKYPGSLEAAYAQMHMMMQDVKSHQKKGHVNSRLLRSVLAINPAYRSTSLYSELKVGVLKWMIELVTKYKKRGQYHDELFKSIVMVKDQNIKTSLVENLRKLAIEWQVALGVVELTKADGSQTARKYFDNAEKLGISDREARLLNEKLKAAGIRAMMRKGQKDEAEMALVEWEVEDPESSVLIELKKEFDRPIDMVTIPSGKVKYQWVGSFNLDKYEVTNAQFLEFIKANPSFRKSKMTSDRNDLDYLKRWNGDRSFSSKYKTLPVVFVSQIVSAAYCEWKGKRLPTDLEWSMAAGKGKRNYPWGNQPPSKKLANFDKGIMGNPTHGESHPAGATPEGVMHMASKG